MLFLSKYPRRFAALFAAAVILTGSLLSSGCSGGNDPAQSTPVETTEQDTSGADPTDTQDSSAAYPSGGETDSAAGQETEADPGTYAEAIDLEYLPTDKRCKMDLIYYDNGEKKPVLVLVHGGSYYAGDKADMAAYQQYYAKNFVTASINYPLLPDATLVQQYRSVITAIEFLAKYADRINADMDRVVIAGYSAGAQLAVRASQEIVERADNSFKLSAVIDIAGPVDLAAVLSNTDAGIPFIAGRSEIVDGISGADFAKEYAKIDCMAHISAAMPPVLIIHGKEDRTVSPLISADFYAKLKAAGVYCEAEFFEGETHTINRDKVMARMNVFLRKLADQT